MNWELLSEKLSRDEETVFIFCAKEDRNDPFITNRISRYRKKGLKVIVKRNKKKENDTT